MVLAALYNWVYDKLQRLNSEYATLIRKVQKLGISSSEADRTIAQLRFDDLVKGFHVCIVDVAAMIDIITIAISAIVLKAMTPRATA